MLSHVWIVTLWWIRWRNKIFFDIRSMFIYDLTMTHYKIHYKNGGVLGETTLAFVLEIVEGWDFLRQKLYFVRSYICELY